jgi:hypothetical protein
MGVLLLVATELGIKLANGVLRNESDGWNLY